MKLSSLLRTSTPYIILAITTTLILILHEAIKANQDIKNTVQTLASIATSIGIVTALFKDKLIQLIYNPKLTIYINHGHDYFSRIQKNNLNETWLRLKVTNNGDVAAENVSVRVEGIFHLESGKRVKYISKLLKWQFNHGTCLDKLPVNGIEFIDIGCFRMTNTKLRFHLKAEVEAYADDNELENGTYKIILNIYASNADPSRWHLTFHIRNEFNLDRLATETAPILEKCT